MKMFYVNLLRVSASHLQNCQDNFTIDLVARSRETAEDKKYELQEVAKELFVYSTAAFVGRNASGKTTASEQLDCYYTILGEFRLENKHYSYEAVSSDILFYTDGYKCRYQTVLKADATLKIVAKNMQAEYEKVKSALLPKTFAKNRITLNRQKDDNSTAFYQEYFGGRCKLLVVCIRIYRSLKGSHSKDEHYLAELLK